MKPLALFLIKSLAAGEQKQIISVSAVRMELPLPQAKLSICEEAVNLQHPVTPSVSLQQHHRRTGRGAHPIESIYLHPLTTSSLSLRASAPSLPRRNASERVRGDSRFFKCQSARIAATGHPYWITSHHLPSQPGSVLAGGQPALSLCARASRSGAAAL